MQLALASINEENLAENLPELEMGIGVHTGQVVLGNIGSPERMKYGVVGTHVNLTSRIQSFTTGGQVLVSEATRREVGPMLKTGNQTEVRAKGFEQPLTLYEAVAIGAPHKLTLPQHRDNLIKMDHTIKVSYHVADEVHLNGELQTGSLIRLSAKQAELQLEAPVPIYSNLELVLTGTEGKTLGGSLYCKVVNAMTDGNQGYLVHFTSMSPEIETFIHGRLQ